MEGTLIFGRGFSCTLTSNCLVAYRHLLDLELDDRPTNARPQAYQNQGMLEADWRRLLEAPVGLPSNRGGGGRGGAPIGWSHKLSAERSQATLPGTACRGAGDHQSALSLPTSTVPRGSWGASCLGLSGPWTWPRRQALPRGLPQSLASGLALRACLASPCLASPCRLW